MPYRSCGSARELSWTQSAGPSGNRCGVLWLAFVVVAVHGPVAVFLATLEDDVRTADDQRIQRADGGDVAVVVMQTMQERFAELLKTIDQVAFQHLDIRLVNYLKQKTKSTGSSLVNLSHKQIAEDLSTNRVVISRLLKKLEDQKKILLYRNQIKVLRAL